MFPFRSHFSTDLPDRRITWIIFLLFFPACLSVLRQVIWGADLSHHLLGLALLLLCLEQSRMAVVDLEQIAEVRKQIQDDHLTHFSRITVSTIVLELLGFYAAGIALGWGAVLVLFSLVWFNWLAGIQLSSTGTLIQPWGISQRLPILIADAIGLLLVGLWMMNVAPIWMATGLLGMILAYISLKYFSSSSPT